MKTRSELNKLDVLRMLLLTLEIIFAALSFGIAAGTHFFRRAENLFGETFGGDLDRYQAGIYVTIALAAAGCALAALMLLWNLMSVCTKMRISRIVEAMADAFRAFCFYLVAGLVLPLLSLRTYRDNDEFESLYQEEGFVDDDKIISVTAFLWTAFVLALLSALLGLIAHKKHRPSADVHDTHHHDTHHTTTTTTTAYVDPEAAV